MNAAALIQLAVSIAGVAAMIGIAALATRGLGAPPLDEAAARRWLFDEYPDARIDGLWLAADGLGAVARSGDAALVLSRLGDGYVARRIAWAAALRAAPRAGRVSLPLSDFAAPRVVLALPAWPPRDLTA